VLDDVLNLRLPLGSKTEAQHKVVIANLSEIFWL
jgi:hypothetical protein